MVPGGCLFFRRIPAFPLPSWKVSRTSEQGFDKDESLGRERGEFEGREGTFLQKGSLSPLNILLFLLFLALAAKKVLDALDDLVADGLLSARFELAEQFFLTRGKVGRRLHEDLDQQIAVALLIEIGQPLAGQTEHRPALRAFGNLELQIAVKSGNRDGMPKGGLHERDLPGQDKILPLAAERLVLVHRNEHVQIAVGAAVGPGFAFIAEAEAGPGVHTGGDTDRKLAGFLYLPFAPAFGARLGDGVSLTVTGRTGNHELEKALRIPDLAGAAALAAGFAGRPRRGARAVAFPAGGHPGDVQGDFRTPRRLREGDVQIVAQIRARRGARPAAACTAAHAESKHIPKDIAEMSEDIFGGPKASEVAVVSDTGVTELIVPRPALRIAQHFIGFGGLFETLFGFRVVGVVVGVVLQCHLAVSPLDFVFRRIAGYTENFIIIALGHSGSNLSRQKGLVVHVRLRFACRHTILGHILRTKTDGSNWRVAVQSPDDTEDYLGVLSIQDKAVITSGGYERYFEQDGVTYHHIIDPKTGYPAENGLVSVTIVSSDGTLADGLSTSLFIMGEEKAAEFWKAHSNEFEAIFATDDGTIYVTEGLKDSFTTDLDMKVITK